MDHSQEILISAHLVILPNVFSLPEDIISSIEYKSNYKIFMSPYRYIYSPSNYQKIIRQIPIKRCSIAYLAGTHQTVNFIKSKESLINYDSQEESKDTR